MKKIYNRRYMGGKNKLIPHIIDIINNLDINFSTFYEPFGGTGVVSYELANFFQLKTVYINDFLFSNFIIYNAVFKHKECDYNKLKKIIQLFNSNDYFDNYFLTNFGNKFFSNENANKIGGIRQQIQEFYKKKEINYYEFCSLVTSLIYSMDRIANTVGHYEAYIRNGILNKKIFLELVEPLVNNSEFIISNVDVTLENNLPYVDIVYLDPPYNSRQYSSAYHLLENVAEWKKKDVVGVASKINLKKINSKFSLNIAKNEFEKLILKINAKYIIVSYNDTYKEKRTRSSAIMNSSEIINILNKRGNVKHYDIKSNAFNTGKTLDKKINEKLFICEVKKNEN